MTKEESLRRLISNYINQKDWAKLDALYQWATTPTGSIAMNGYPPNHGLIQNNLKLRYGLTGKQTEDVYANFKADIGSAGFEFNAGYLEVRKDIAEYFAQDSTLRGCGSEDVEGCATK